MDDPNIKELTKAWLTNKQLIASGKVNNHTILRMLETFAPENKKNKYEETLVDQKIDFSGETYLIPGFKMQIPLENDLDTRLLMNTFKHQKDLMPFDVDMTLSPKDENGHHTLNISPKGDFTSFMANPRYSRIMDFENYVRYSVFRGVAQAMARGQLYQFNPDGLKMPTTLPYETLDGVKHRDALVLTERVYVPTSTDVKRFLEANLTALDRLGIEDEFNQSFQTSINLHQRLSTCLTQEKELNREMQSPDDKDVVSIKPAPTSTVERPRLASG
jgi:hypothetical protein